MTVNQAPAPARDLTKFAWLSIATAIFTIALKAGAWWITGSVGLLADAAESVINLVAAFIALYALRVAARPADEDHHFGHSKAEYFSAAIEGQMIFVAAVFILWTSVQRFLNPQPLESVGIGLAISIVASVANGLTAWVLMRQGRKHRSSALIADGKHLMTDVYTSIGVVVAVLLVWITGWDRLDPIIAFAVGINIIIVGWKLLNESGNALLDAAWPEDENNKLARIVQGFANDDISFHGLRTREAGHQRFAEVHVLVPGVWTVQRGHDVLEDLEAAVRAEFGEVELMCHLEPREDPRSYDDYATEVKLPTVEGTPNVAQ